MAKMTKDILLKINKLFDEGKYIITNEGKIYKRLADGSIKEHGSRHQRGYINFWINIDGVTYRTFAHRINYYFVHGIWDDNKVINHIDGNKSNNRIDNLQMMTQFENIIYCIRNGEMFIHPTILLSESYRQKLRLNDEQWSLFKEEAMKAYERDYGKLVKGVSVTRIDLK